MFQLDVRSVILLTGLLGLLMSAVLYYVRRSYPPSIRGLDEWALAPALIFGSAVLFAARGHISDVLSIVGANLLMFSSAACYYIGTRRFLGLSSQQKRIGALVFVAMLPLTWFALVQPHHGYRVFVISTLVGILSFSHAHTLLRHGQRTFAGTFTAAVFLVIGTSQVVRFFSAFSLNAADGVFDTLTPFQTTYVVIYSLATLTVSICVLLMATERLRAELEYQATHDMLTGVLNRRAFIAAAEQEFSRCRRHGHVMSVVLMDLDHFKAINDTHGHLVGDRVITDFARRATDLLRLPDCLGRYGGEEFILLLPETGRESAAVVAERIRAAAASAEGVPRYTVSLGVATNVAADGSLDQVLARADLALYEAKRGGRDRVVLAPVLQEVA